MAITILVNQVLYIGFVTDDAAGLYVHHGVSPSSMW